MTPLCLAALLLGLQEPAPAAPAKGQAEEFPRWKVGGVLATDFSGIASDRHSNSTMEEEGIVGEYSLYGTFHASRNLRATVRLCVGCHEFTLQEAYGELDLSAFSVRAGRLPVPFGGLSGRVNHAQMESSSKPLPYIMGHMVRGEQFNQGILPAPIVDNGFQATATAWLGESAKATLEAAVVRGFVGDSPDLDFEISRDFEDNNGEPAGVARLTVGGGPWTLGASGMYGHYDLEHELAYAVGGVHASLQLGPVGIRAEALARRTDFVDLAGDEDAHRKTAWVVQADWELDSQWRLFAMADGLRVEDIFLGPAGPQVSPFGTPDDSSQVTRGTGGLVYALRPGFLLKTSAEFWDLSDFDDTWVFHFTAVVVF